MLEPIDNQNIGSAIELLARGFPRKSRIFWERALDRIDRYNKLNDYPTLGRLLVVKGARVGVMLTIKSHARNTNGNPHDVINLSSWYVDPEHRRLAPLMLREMIRCDDTVFTDLTPSADVVRMLPLLGFKPLNLGLAAIALPLAALHRRGSARVSSFESFDRSTLHPEDQIRLERNAQFGGMAAILTVNGRHHPLLFASRTVRHIPTASLIYCDDVRTLMDNIHAVARFLLKRGKLMLIVDIPLDAQVRGTQFLGRGLKFAKGTDEVGGINKIDYSGSELLLVV